MSRVQIHCRCSCCRCFCLPNHFSSSFIFCFFFRFINYTLLSLCFLRHLTPKKTLKVVVVVVAVPSEHANLHSSYLWLFFIHFFGSLARTHATAKPVCRLWENKFYPIRSGRWMHFSSRTGARHQHIEWTTNSVGMQFIRKKVETCARPMNTSVFFSFEFYLNFFSH